jgi:hypothetical protein
MLPSKNNFFFFKDKASFIITNLKVTRLRLEGHWAYYDS